MNVKTQRSLLCTTALIGFLVMPSHARSEPQNGQVTGGNAAISQSGTATTINQSSNRAIIRWDSFDLNSSESVRFNQPNTSSITVNRIRDNKPSQINGRISANGNIVLMNPNGVVFGATSTVDVGGLVATTSDLEDDNAFLKGGAVKFTKPGKADAAIVNHGSMTVRDGGLIGLVAPNVENHGVIQARLGKAVLASGDIATVDFAGDGLIKLEVSDAVLSQRVLNTGTITADGGSILLTAAQARGMVEALVTNTGTLRANTVKVAGVERKGEITLSTKGLETQSVTLNLQLPQAQGITFNTGTIEAKGVENTASGGLITILGDTIHIGDGSYVTADGGAQGGSIKIGGEYQGGNGLPTSNKIFISEHVILNAESRKRGKGGTIILWSDDHTQFYGHADASGGLDGGDGGFIEVSGKNTLDFAGTVDLSSAKGKRGVLLLDPTDIVISNSANNNISGSTPFTPVADGGSTVLNVATLQAALASADVIVQTRATGAQAGNITVSNAIKWSSGSTLTLDAHNNIIVNAGITGTNLRFVAGGDVQLASAVTGTGTLTIQQAADGGTVGIGASAVGTLNLNATDLGNITNGWNNIVIGKSTATAGMDVRATTWNDNLTLVSGSGTITVNGIVNVGANNLNIITDGDIALTLSNALTGTGNLSVSQTSVGTTMGLGGGAGTINLTSTEVGRIANGWANLTFGRTDGTGAITMAAVTWNDFLTVQSGSGVITVSGTQTFGANNLTMITNADIVLNGALTGTAALSIYGASAGTTMGIGDSQTGTINFTNAETARFTNGWASLAFGRTDGSGAINVGALTWNDNLTVQTGAGVINVNGDQTMGANNLTYRTDADLVIGGNLIGTGTLSFTQSSANTSIGIGNAQPGTLSFSAADLARITDGWTTIAFGRDDGTADMEVGATTWTDGLSLSTGSGIIRINGTQTLGANALSLRTSSNIFVDGDLSGTGAFSLVQSSAGASMGIGTSETGDVHLDDTEMTHILDGWSSRTFGRTDSTGGLNVGAATWVDPLVLRTGSGILRINGNQTMGANALSLISASDMVINGNLSGSTTLSITGSLASTSIGLGDGQTGDLLLSTAEVNRIVNGWTDLYLGSTTQTGALNIGALTWNDRTNFRTLSGQLSFNGANNFLTNNVLISTNSDIAINDTLTSTGSLTITATTSSTTMGIGTGQVGTINFSDEEIDRINNTFSVITFGATNQTGAVNIGASTWRDPVTIRNSSGLMSVNGAMEMGANNLTLSTNSNIAINAAINGTGSLSITPSTGSVSMGVGTGQAGTINISDAEIALFSNTLSLLGFGSTSMTGALNIAGRTWNNSVEYRTNTGAMNINGVQNMGTKNLSLRTNSNLTLSQNLVGSGTLSFVQAGTGTTMGVGDSQTGTLNLTNAELAYIVDGWSTIVFGRTDSTAALNVGARTWTDSVDFRNGTGIITFNGAQNVGANNLIVRANSNTVVSAALTGTGNLTFTTPTATTTYGIGSGQSGTVNFTDAELDLFTNGWSLITFGGNAVTGVMNVGARTWNDNLMLNTSTGVITLAAQTMGANNLTIRTSANPVVNGNLSGSGILTFDTNSASTTIGLGSTTSGTMHLTDTELGRIVNGWSNIVFGRIDGTGAMNIGGFTWNDNVTYQTAGGLMTVSGALSMGSNNLSLITNSNLALNGNLSGTGNLVLSTASGATTMGIGTGQTGVFALDNAELARIQDGWGRVTIGGTGVAGNMNIGAYTWLNPMSFLTLGDVVLNGDQVSTELSGNTLVFATLNGSFVNNAGSDAINAGGGRYLVYSVDENNDTLGGIIRPGIITNKTYGGYGPDSVVESGSQHIYSGLVSKILYLVIDDVDKVYGDALPAFTYTYVSGLVNGDTLNTVVLGYTMNALGASVFDDAGTNRTITGNFNLDLGYSVIVTNGTMTVVKASLVVEADPVSRTYGDANPALTISYTGFKNGEDETDIDTLATASTTANALSNVGNYDITSSGAFDNNYDFVYVDGSLAVTKATLITTMQNTSRVYGDANPTFTATYSGFKNGQNSSVIDTGAVGASIANATSNVGTYAITGSGALDDNYAFSYVNGTLTVNKAALVATANNASRAYGDANPALGVTYTGFKNGETFAVIDTQATAATSANATSGVGTYAITASGAVDNNYSFTYANGTLTVNKAMLTATAGNASREYGDANPSIGVSYSGFKNGETASVINTGATASSAATGTTNVGTIATTASGASDDNYDFTYVNGVLTITKATLIATADDAVRIYGDANPSIGVTYSGFKNGETFAVIDTLATASSAATTASNVGTYNTTASGAFDNNYTFTYTNGTLAVNKATLTATAGNATRIYGDANPAIGVTYSGFRNGQNSSVIDILATGATAAMATTGVGTYATTASGAFDNNYDFNYVDGVVTINKATLTATAGNQTREYGEANPSIGVTYTGFKNGETDAVIDTLATGASAANATSNVGNYATTASGAFDDNYTFTYANGTLSVTKAMLTVTAADASRNYGDANPAIGVTYSGFKNGETSAVINTVATGSAAATTASSVGTYATVASGASDNNYAFTYVNGTLTINKAMLTATAGNATRVYGDANPAIGVTYSGFKNGQNSSVIDTLATGATAAIATTGVGTYATTASGASDNNYDFNYVDGVLSINKATLAATAQSVTREYGDVNPAIGVTYTGFKNGETDAVIDTLASGASAASTTSNVGTYATTASGAFDDNYAFTYTNGTLAVTKATLLVTADDKTRVYGNANPAFTFTYTGFKNGETVSVINVGASGSSLANAASDVGDYAITGSGASDNNYSFTYADGTLAITKAMLTATANTASRAYGDANPAIGVTYTGFKNGQNASVIDTLATASSAANATSGVGAYASTVSGASDNNYDFTYVDGTLNITKAVLIATAGDVSREYGDANPSIGVTYTGFKNGETDSVIDTLATGASAASVTSNVGSYNTTASGAFDDNYTFTYANGTLTVTKATLLATANDTSRQYGLNNPSFTATYTGFKNGQTASVIDTLATGASAATILSNTGTYGITMSGASDNNYDFTYAGGTLTITKANLTVTPDNISRDQGVANPPLTISYSGFRNGDTQSVLDSLATATTTANAGSAIGTYAITASGGTDNNYSFNYVNGTLTVLDPGYVPPPPAPPPSALPSTVTASLNRPVQYTMVQTSLQAPAKGNDVYQNIVVVGDAANYDTIWQKDHFLIAMTDAVKDYYNTVNSAEERRRP